jgi:DNA-binding SARP family transcriptional activator/tetratricopeptide (TPR) repeat protein
MPGAMDFGLLGPLVVRSGDAEVAVRRGHQRALLAILLLEANRLVPVDAITEALWGPAPPRSAPVAIRSYIRSLRLALGPAGMERISTQPRGYLIRVADGELDLARFEHLLASARAAARSGCWQEAAGQAREALSCWRGEPLADIESDTLALREVPRLAELRLQAVETRIDAGLRLGDHAEVTGELQYLCAAHPLREHLHALLMLALYRCGRQADALAAYQHLRAMLVEELGADPGAELQTLHRQILGADPALAARQPTAGAMPVYSPGPAGRTEPGAAGGMAPIVPRQLPARVAHFTGRAGELAALTQLLDQAGGDPPGAVVISAIGGLAGVGKTALAVHWAHLTADRFPDGQLYVNLRGFGPSDSPMTSAEAVRLFLDGLGVAPERVPVGLDAQAALYRSLLAGKRMLVVLDNAHDPGQVRPLLPGAPGCLVLVTSRNQLTGLVAGEGAHLVCLDVLNEAEAQEMLAQRLGRSRVAGEPATVTELIRLCARLPLALSIAAARAAARPGLPLATVAAELRDVRARLDALSTGEAATDVRTVFSWSFRQLSTPAARMFRLLGVHPGPDITTPAAASLAGVAQVQADQALVELKRAHLITEHAPGRFACHDLVRAYAAEQARDLSQVQRHAATRRMLDHYLHTAYEASFLVHPYRGSVSLEPSQPRVRAEGLGERRHAMAWFRAERQVLLAVIGQAAADREFSVHAWQLPWAVAIFLDWAGYWQDLAVTQGAALAAASWAQDRAAQAEAHHYLGRAHMRMGAFAESRAHVTAVLELGQQLGNGLLQARAQYNLSRICELQGSTHDALSHAEQALRLYRAARNRSGEANALNSVGWLCAQLGRYEEALHSCERSLALLREQGNPVAEAGALDSLGYIHHHLGNHGQAISCCRQANEVLGNSSDLQLRTEILTHLGDAHQASGDTGAARHAWQQALDILEDLHHPDAEQVRSRLGRCPDRSINGGVTSATGRNPGC